MAKIVKHDYIGVNEFDQEEYDSNALVISDIALHNAMTMCEVELADEIPTPLLRKIEKIEELIRRSNPHMDPSLVCLRSTQIMAMLVNQYGDIDGNK